MQFSCSECAIATIKTKAGLKKHLLLMHKIDSEAHLKKFECEKCGKTFKQRNYLTKHNKHTNCAKSKWIVHINPYTYDSGKTGHSYVQAPLVTQWLFLFADTAKISYSLPDKQDQYPLEMRTSQRGGQILVDIERYRYRWEASSKNNHKSYWICLLHKKTKCAARLQTVGNDFKIVNKRGVHACKLPWWSLHLAYSS